MSLCISKIAEEEIEILLKLLREKAYWLIKIGYIVNVGLF